jgi:hypothetical protein
MSTGEPAPEPAAPKMGFFSMVSQGYGELVNAIIRPPRAEYEVADLGPREFTIGQLPVLRSDIELVGPRGKLQCSHWTTGRLDATGCETGRPGDPDPTDAEDDARAVCPRRSHQPLNLLCTDLTPRHCVGCTSLCGRRRDPVVRSSPAHAGRPAAPANPCDALCDLPTWQLRLPRGSA